jgi:ABC-type sulfate transport system permease component
MVKRTAKLEKMSAHSGHSGTAAGTAGGTLLTIFANIHSEDVFKTAALACIGAVVSFSISLLLKWLSKKMRRTSTL